MIEQRIIHITRCECIFPAGDHVILLDLLKGQLHGFPIAHWMYTEHLLESVVTGHHLHPHTVDQIDRQLVRSRRYEVQPIGRQPRRHHRDRHDGAPQSPDSGKSQQHLLVSHNIRATNIEGLVVGIFAQQHARQVFQYVADSNRLAARIEPAGSYHYGQLFYQIPHDFERRTAGTHDDTCLKCSDGKPRSVKYGRHIFAGSQVA